METILLKDARYKIKATRDAAGVPHVYAKTFLEAIYGLGYLHAIDRPTQMVFSRSVASGVAAEKIINKPELFEMDSFLRRAGLAQNLSTEVASLSDETRTQIQYYCDGVNDGMGKANRTLPMWMTGFQPEPWNPEAVILIGNLLSFAGLAVGEQEDKRVLLELLQLGVNETRVRELFSPYLDGIDFKPLQEIKIAKTLSNEALEVLADLPRLAGSNAWAVSPGRSFTNQAMLASDPHLEVNRLPAIWYEASLNWENEEFALGATLPGCPLMSVGRTKDLAWGVTYLHANTSDFFIEDCRPGGKTGWQYRRGENWHDFKLRNETIMRKGGSEEVLSIYENKQGTLSRTPDKDQPGKYLSVKWIGTEPGGGRSLGCWLKIMQTKNTQQAMKLVRHNPHPSLVWIFADREGHIGKQASGWLPQRSSGNSGIVPLAAWDEANHWRGPSDPEMLPREYDPPCQFVVSANEELYRPDGRPIHSHALPDYRKRRIDELLTGMPLATLADMQAIQYDVLSTQARDLLPMLLAPLEASDFKKRLTKWDLSYRLDSTEATLFQHFYRHVILQIFGQEKGIGWQRMFYLSTRIGYSTMVLTAIDRVLRKVTSSWWQERDKADLIRKAAVLAAAEPVQPWAIKNQFHFVNRFLDLGQVGRLFGLRSAAQAMIGCQATPFQGHLLATAKRESTFAPSYHFVTDLGTNEAWTNLPGGPSESSFSKWYQTDISRWLQGEYKLLTPTIKENIVDDSSDESI